MEKIFLAFGGRKDQNSKLDKISQKENLTLLNLEKFSQEELNQYLINQNIALPYPHIVTEIQYDEKVFYSWGIIYEFEEEYFYSFVFILELYLNNFLYPLFQFYRGGYEKLKYDYFDTFKDGYLPNINIDNLHTFLNTYIGIIDYSYWSRSRIYDWVKNGKNESFRFYTGLSLYQGLREYSIGKSHFFWKKEVMEMGIILETLFTEPTEKESIGYVLRKRIHFLSIDIIPDIEKKVKDIYNTRSNFVHGSTFIELKKMYEIVGENGDEDIKENYENGMFDITKDYITTLRKIVLLYYTLINDINSGFYDKYFSTGKKITCIDIIELSMFEENIQMKFKKNIDTLRNIISY